MGFAVPSLLGRFAQGFCVGGGDKEAAVGSEGSRVLSRGGDCIPRPGASGEREEGEEEKIAPRGDK